MSLQTAYRYEAITKNVGLQSALQRQQERIRIDEMMATREHNAKIEEDIKFKSNWIESLEHVSAVQKAKSDARQSKNEIRLAQKAGIMVRQAALKHLLETEYKLFEKELHSQGKSFYIKRT